MSHTELLYAIAAVFANVLGALAITARPRWSPRALEALLAFAAGFLISVALVDLFPEAVKLNGPRAGVVALVAYALVHLTQHVIGQHFHFGEETHHVTAVVSVSALVGLLLHTFVDGVAVASSLHVSASLGLLVLIAVLLHKVPEGLAISSLFLAAGAGRKRATLAAVALGATTVAGLLVADYVPLLREYGLAISAGVAIYVGASNLVPEFQGKGRPRLSAAFVVGCVAYLGARTLAGG